MTLVIPPTLSVYNISAFEVSYGSFSCVDRGVDCCWVRLYSLMRFRYSATISSVTDVEDTRPNCSNWIKNGARLSIEIFKKADTSCSLILPLRGTFSNSPITMAEKSSK